jgi:hypothetical protein
MFSRNLIPFSAISAILVLAMMIGILRNPVVVRPSAAVPENGGIIVPSIGRVQVLNGCGAEGAADKMTDFLRTKKFDVKNTGNAPSWNYPFTIVVSRSPDMTVARQIAKALNTDHIVLIRKDDRTYDVTVIIGPDYRERIR